jgi:hypothetical protein
MTNDQDEKSSLPDDVYGWLAADVVATLGWSAEEAMRFVDHGGRSAGFFDVLVAAEDVQQHFHDDRIDTTWPACPEHPHHPLRLTDRLPALWTCPSTGKTVCALGDLASVTRKSG